MFTLNPTLEADSFLLDTWPLCQVRLMNDSLYPWLILIPQRVGCQDWMDLSLEDQYQLTQEITQASQKLKQLTQCHKLNVAALGNVVSQLHIHVIGRFKTDSAWPKPVWGMLPTVPYSESLLEQFKASWPTAKI